MGMRDTQTVKFVVLNRNAKAPTYQTEGSAGADLAYCGPFTATVPAGGHAVLETGIAIALPEGYEAQVRSRSGLAAKHGVYVLNSPGTIDEDYRGEIKVILHNSSASDMLIEPGTRIAQLVISRYTRGVFREVESLEDTERGAGGFGSTGEK